MRWVLFVAIGIGAIAATVVLIGMMLPEAHVVSRTARFKSPPQTIWDLITGPSDWRPDMSSYVELPARSGHRAWKEVDKQGQAITFEAMESQPPNRFVTRIDPGLPFGGTWTYDIAREPDGSRLTITEDGRVYNPLFRFVSRFIMGHTATIDGYLKAVRAKLGDA